VIEMIADSQHFCDRFKFNREEIEAAADAHYRAER
jgi:hypothetical protein